MSWTTRAACQDADEALFFDGDEAQAKQICQVCPVQESCRQHALTTPERWGVWGGMTADERAEHRGDQHGLTIPAVHPGKAPDQIVDATSARLKLRALARIGHGLDSVRDTIATTDLGPVGDGTLAVLRAGRRSQITLRLAQAIDLVYPVLLETSPVSPRVGHIIAAAELAGWPEPDDLVEVAA